MKAVETSPNFNSMKVRLIPNSLAVSFLFLIFQFHEGSINTQQIALTYI